MSACFQKGGSAGEVWDIADNDASGGGALDAEALYCQSPSSPQRAPQSRGTDGFGLLSPLWKCSRNQNIFHCTDEICLKQGRSCKAALGNTSISFSKLLFSHAGGKSLQVKCNHPAVGFALSGIIILGWVPGIANIKLVI